MTELQTTQSTAVATLDNDDEYAGLTPSVTRIAFPGAGGTAFTLPDESVAQSVDGVVVYNHGSTVLWLTEMGKSNIGDGSPVATSDNGVDQIVTANGLDVIEQLNAERKKKGKEPLPIPAAHLAMCPYNQKGSKQRYIDSDAHPFATATQHKRVLYVLRVGSSVPDILQLPFKSIRPFSNYAVSVKMSGGPSAVLTRIKLVKTTNKTGATYAEAVFELVRPLDETERAQAAEAKLFAKSYATGGAEAPASTAVDALASKFDAEEVPF